MSSYDISMVMFAFEYTNLFHNIIPSFGNHPGEWYRSHTCWSGWDPNPYITHFKRLLLSELISLTENDHNGEKNINKIKILKCLIS